jgi:hypothetical protein
MEQLIVDYIRQTKFESVQSHSNLSVYPLLSSYRDALTYSNFDEALANNLISVTEVSEGGSVPLLRVENHSKIPVLIVDGEELVGAKQNRAVNTTVLIPAAARIKIPVSCVEQGRWSYNSRLFKSGDRIMPAKIRARKAEQVRDSLRNEGSYVSSQRTIWSEINELAASLEASSPSMEMGAIYRKQRPRLDQYTAAFTPLAGQLGAVFLVNDQPAGVEAFGKPETFAKLFRRLVESYALAAINTREEDFAIDSDSHEKALCFFAAIRACGIESRPSIGLGTDLRLESCLTTGFALVHERQILHLSAFNSWRF